MWKVDDSYKTNVCEKHIVLNEYKSIFITFQINNIITLKCYGRFGGVSYLVLAHIRKKQKYTNTHTETYNLSGCDQFFGFI